MNRDTQYPQWYRTFRAFLLGLAMGALIMAVVCARSEPEAIGLVHSYIWPIFIQFALFMIFSGFEIFFAIRRHNNLVRELRHRPTP